MHTLTHGPFALVADPALGGAVRSFTFDGRDILRPSRSAKNVLDASAFPMLPYTGRVSGARFEWEGEPIELPRNFPPEPHAIHGTGWQAEWEVEAIGDAFLELSHTPSPAAWPWRCTMRQVFTLGPEGLSLLLSVENRSTRDMPAGIGWHPYFVRGDAELSVATLAMWANDESGVSAGRVPPPVGLDGSHACKVGSLDLDNAFDVAAVDAVLEWPGQSLRARIQADRAFRNLVIYAPPGAEHVCIEPSSHAPDALNTHPDPPSDMTRLAPGEILRGTVRLSVARARATSARDTTIERHHD